MTIGDKFAAANHWARSLQMRACVSEHHERAVWELWPWLKSLEIKSALEVGAGEPPYLVTRMLQEHGIDAVTLDAVSTCDVEGDVHDLPLEDNSRDLVAARHVLEHVLCPYLALAEMARVSRKWLLIVVPWDSDKACGWPDHFWCLPRKGWELMFRKLNLAIIQFEEGNHNEQGGSDDREWRYLLSKAE